MPSNLALYVTLVPTVWCPRAPGALVSALALACVCQCFCLVPDPPLPRVSEVWCPSSPSPWKSSGVPKGVVLASFAWFAFPL